MTSAYIKEEKSFEETKKDILSNMTNMILKANNPFMVTFTDIVPVNDNINIGHSVIAMNCESEEQEKTLSMTLSKSFIKMIEEEKQDKK